MLRDYAQGGTVEMLGSKRTLQFKREIEAQA